MNSLRLQGFRGFEDTGKVPIRRITVLVGANSTGKSSFLRVFPLIRQSIQTRTSGPILWFDEHLVDFGNFEEVRRRDSDGKSICFEFGLKLQRTAAHVSFRFKNKKKFYTHYLCEKILVKVKLKEKQNTTYISSVELSIMNDTSEIYFDELGNIKECKINSKNYNISSEYFVDYNGLIPIICHKKNLFVQAFEENNVVELLKEIAHGKTKGKTYEEISSSLMYCDNKELRKKSRDASNSKFWKDKIDTTDEIWFNNLRESLFFRELPFLLRLASEELLDNAMSTAYIGPFRANPQRYYRLKELAVDELDSVGTNLPIFLNSLTEEERISFKEWLSKHMEFEVGLERLEGHVILTIGFPGQEHFNLADMGFGFSQVLPVLAQLWFAQRRVHRDKNRHIERFLTKQRRNVRILAIEQPELHLHPLYQSRLADMFVASTKASKELNIILETHSMALVERLGELIEEKQVKKEDVCIVLFSKSNDTCKVNLAEFDNKGFLKDWPPGFLSR